MIYKYCRRCGRRLIGEENRLRGYGETCYEKAQREAQARPLIAPKNSTQENPKAPATETRSAQGQSAEGHTGTHPQRTQSTEPKTESTGQGTQGKA